MSNGFGTSFNLFAIYNIHEIDTYCHCLLSGRFDLDVLSSFQCPNCSHNIPYELDLECVLSLGFWPGTPTNLSTVTYLTQLC